MEVQFNLLNFFDVRDAHDAYYGRDGILPLKCNECGCLPKTCRFSFLLQE